MYQYINLFQDQCEFEVPTALIINKKFLADNTIDREIEINGNLQVHQLMSLQCPFFMRNIKSLFSPEILNNNHSTLSDFKLKEIERKLQRNPAHFYYEEKSTYYGDLRQDGTSIKINMKIQEHPLRYKKSFWQNVSHIWIIYLSFAVITFILANYFLTYLFTSHWLWARKRNYVTNKLDWKKKWIF